jgi:hypothetical protein
VSVVLNISFVRGGEGVFISPYFFVESGDGVVKSSDGGLVGLFPRTDGGGEGADDVDKESGAVLV